MKAKEYYEKYRPLLFEVQIGREMTIKSTGKTVYIPKTDEEYEAILQQLWRELVDELSALLKKRKATTDRVFLAAVGEINDKYSAICDLFEKNFGWSPLLRNQFKTQVLDIARNRAEADSKKGE